MTNTVSWRRGLAALTFLFVAATPVAAQAITVTPADELIVGETASIRVDIPSHAGQTIVLRISGGVPLQVVERFVTLDSTGQGKTTWVTANWTSAAFNAPTCPQVTIPIEINDTND